VKPNQVASNQNFSPRSRIMCEKCSPSELLVRKMMMLWCGWTLPSNQSRLERFAAWKENSYNDRCASPTERMIPGSNENRAKPQQHDGTRPPMHENIARAWFPTTDSRVQTIAAPSTTTNPCSSSHNERVEHIIHGS